MDTGRKGVYDAKTGHVVNSTSCSCHACRRKYGLLRKDERERLKADKEKAFLDSVPLVTVLLFCRHFPKGFRNSCRSRYFGFCGFDEQGCVRWNSLGDKMDYSVGLPNPFGGG